MFGVERRMRESGGEINGMIIIMVEMKERREYGYPLQSYDMGIPTKKTIGNSKRSFKNRRKKSEVFV